MTSIASDSMKIALELELNDQVTAGLAKVKYGMNKLSEEAKELQRSMDVESRRNTIESDFNPELKRDIALKALVTTQKELNLSVQAHAALHQEIIALYEKESGITARNASTQKAFADDITERGRQAKDLAKEKTDTEKRYDDEAFKHRISNMTALQRAEHDHRTTHRRLVKEEKDGLISPIKADNAKTIANQILQKAEDKELEIITTANNKKLQEETRHREKLLANFVKRGNEIQAKRDAEAKARIASTVGVNVGQQDHMMVQYQKDQNIQRQTAINLLEGTRDASQRATHAIDALNLAHQRGFLTADQHAEGIENLNRRMQMMQGGAGRAGYVIGNLATGVEDFVTVMSMSGFSMESFSRSTMSMSNNIGQAVRMSGMANAAMLAPMLSMAAIAVGIAVPAIYRWITGAEDAAAATTKWRKELEALTRSFTYFTEMEAAARDRRMTKREIQGDEALKNRFGENEMGGIRDPKAVIDRITSVQDALEELEIKIKSNKGGLAADAQGMWDKMVPQSTVNDFNDLANAIGEFVGGDEETAIRDKMAKIRAEFNTDVEMQGGAAATENLEKKMKAFSIDLQKQIKDSGLSESLQIELKLGIDNDMLAFAGFTDASIVDAIQALNEEIAAGDDSAKKGTEEWIKLNAERKARLAELVDLQKQMGVAVQAERDAAGEAAAESMHLEGQRIEVELEQLRIQNTRNRLLGDENEAERKLLDLALRRREVMESGIAAPAELEAMLLGELEAMAKELENTIFNVRNVTGQNATASTAEAYTSANAQTLAASSRNDTQQKEQIQLLTAIRDAIRNGGHLAVELIQ